MTIHRHAGLLWAIGFALVAGRAWAADTGAPSAPAPVAAPAPADQSSPSATASAPIPPKPPVTVMFTPDEAKAIEQAFMDHDHPSAEQLAAQALSAAVVEAKRPRIPNIYVSAVLDFGGGDWTVWANGLRVTPDQQSPLFKVVAVHGNIVEISVTSDGGTRIALQPYQTWRSRQRDVVEGIVP